MHAMGFLQLLIVVVLVFTLPTLLRRLRQWMQGSSREALVPSGDPMRYALASAVLKGTIFRRRVIEMAQNPFLASAPEQGLNLPLLVNACKAMETADRRWQWAMTALLILPLVLPTIAIALGLYDLSGLVSLIVVFSWIGLLVLSVHRRWRARFQDVRPFRSDEYDFESVRSEYGEATGVEAGFDPKTSNVVVFGETNPFVGFGTPLNSWQVAVDLTRPGANGSTPRPVETQEIYDAVLNAIRGLNLPNLEITQIAFVNGTEVSRLPEIQKDRMDPPAHQLPAATVNAWRDNPNAPARVYVWMRLPTSQGEVVQNYLFRCVRHGEALMLETFVSVVRPVARGYRDVDSIRRLGFFGIIEWGLTALALTPLTVLSALAGVLGQLREALSNLFGGPIARERKEIRLNPMYNYGARETVREMMMANAYNLYFQRADGGQMNQAIDLQVLNATVDLLRDAGVDVSALTQQTATIMQSNVTITTAGGNVAIGGSANVGSVLGRVAGAGTSPKKI